MAHILSGPHAGKSAEAGWQIAVAGREGEITVRAASLSNERASQTDTVHQVHSAGDLPLTILRDENGQVVFQAATQSIAYVRRFP